MDTIATTHQLVAAICGLLAGLLLGFIAGVWLKRDIARENERRRQP